MNERELGKALLKLDAADLSGVPEMRQQTLRILDRDKRRVRLLASLTLGLWLIAAVVISFVLYVFYWHIVPKQMVLIRNIGVGQAPPPDVVQQVVSVHITALQKGTVIVAVSVATLTLAALGTVLLVFASRRATLRQVNASLVEISEQLKQLRQPPA